MTLSLRTRLTVWYTALLVTALTAFCAVILWLHWNTLLRQQDEGLRAIAAAAARTMRNEFEEVRHARAAAAEAEDTLGPVGVNSVCILDASGSSVSGRGRPFPFTSVPLETGAWTVTAGSAQQRRVVVIQAGIGGVPYFVEAATSLDEALTQHRALWRVCLIGWPLMIVLAGGGGWWLAHRALRPLARLAREAEAIDASAPERRLSPPGAPELDQVATSFNQVLERLSTALADQRRFMADASHELRTPLSTIRTAADVTLSREEREPSEYRDALTTISHQSSRLGRLVDDMFLLARADAGGYPLSMVDVDLASIVQESVEDLSARAADCGVGLAIDAGAAPTIAGDESLIRRLVLNLLSNAIAYTPAGGQVTASVTNGNGAAILRVADTGAGIPEGARQRVFERFVRLDPSRHEGGAGLGLSIAKWIAEVHHGALAIERSGPEGSVFVARVPVRTHGGDGGHGAVSLRGHEGHGEEDSYRC